jgi:hypothetical protein
MQAYQTSQYAVPQLRHFSCPIYTVFIVQAYQTSQYVVPPLRHFARQVAQLFRRKFRRKNEYPISLRSELPV